MARRTLVRLGAAAVCGGALIVGVSGLAGGQPNPPGNNGTVKIDDIPFDDHPNNEPHVGCVFQVDFYGYDQGDLTATVTFEGIPPTGGGVLLTDEVPIGEDPAGGGTDLDASRTYDLTEELAGILPHPQQGWHVRLTVNAEGSIGADVKHKVFWVSGCEAPTTTSTSTTSTSTTSTSTTSTSTTSTTQPGSTTTTAHGVVTTQGPGAGMAPGAPRPAAPAPVPSGQLARTGSHTLPFTIAGLVLMGLGMTALVAERRLRAGATTH